MPGGAPRIGYDDRLGHIVREGIQGGWNHGGVNMLEECWTLGVVQDGL